MVGDEAVDELLQTKLLLGFLDGANLIEFMGLNDGENGVKKGFENGVLGVWFIMDVVEEKQDEGRGDDMFVNVVGKIRREFN